jgi:hypothetical protein
LRVGVDEHFLDRRAVGRAIDDQRRKLRIEMRQTSRKRLGAVRLQPAIGDVAQPVALGADQAPAGRAEARIETEQDQPSFSMTSSETS